MNKARFSKREALSLSPEERHRLLLKSSREYMAGAIKHEQFRADERRYMADYEALTLKLGSLGRLLRLFCSKFMRENHKIA